MCYVFSLRVFKPIDAHTSARIHSFFLTLTRGKMSSHDQILLNHKSYGLLHDENMRLLYGVCRCSDLKVQLITAVSAVLSQIISQECSAR